MKARIINDLELKPMSRGLVFSVVGLLSLAVLPHVQNIRLEILGLFLFFALWRLFALFVKIDIANRWVLYLFAGIGFSIAAWFYGPPVGRTPGIAFLIIMLGLKLIEIKTRRDIRVVLILGYFAVITHFLFNTSFTTIVPMLVLVFGFTWLMMQMGHVLPQQRILSDIKLTAKMFMQALPFAIILFFLFPRLAGSLWILQLGGNSGVTGLSDTLTMGNISELVESNETAFTATFLDDNIPKKSERYWRGEVLWNTDGREWQAGPTVGRGAPRLQASGREFRYNMALESQAKDWLFALDMPTSVPKGARIENDYTLTRPASNQDGGRYSVTSSSQYLASTMSPEIAQRGVALPEGMITDRLTNLVGVLRDGSVNDAQYIDNVLNHFNQNEFVYTLKPPLLTSDQPVDEFLFESQRGFCGHYASSFVTMMRMAHIPARLVVGYLGGEYNPRANQIVVTQSSAHAWAEAWLPERGWVRVDPTTAISPERIESPIDYSSSANDGVVRFSPEVSGAINRFLRESRWFADALKLQWREWFIGFDSKKQKAILKRFGLQHISLSTLGGIAFLSALSILTVIAFLLFRGEQTRPDKVQRLYGKFCRKMARRGYPRDPHEGPKDYLTRLQQSLPEDEKLLDRVINLYIQIRYSDTNSDLQQRHTQQLRQAISQFS